MHQTLIDIHENYGNDLFKESPVLDTIDALFDLLYINRPLFIQQLNMLIASMNDDKNLLFNFIPSEEIGSSVKNTQNILETVDKTPSHVLDIAW